jgi:restriction system protein
MQAIIVAMRAPARRLCAGVVRRRRVLRSVHLPAVAMGRTPLRADALGPRADVRDSNLSACRGILRLLAQWMAPTIRAVRLKLYLVAGVVTGIAAYLLGAAPAWSLTIGLLAPAILAAVPRFLHGTIAGLSTRDDVATEMSGTEFEDYVARIARSSGLPVIMTSITGDWGVDIIVGKRPNRLAIQCKRQARPVGTGAIQEVVAGAPMQDCSKTMVVTNHEFTPAARKLAELHGCELVGRSELPRLRSTIRRLTKPSEPTRA